MKLIIIGADAPLYEAVRVARTCGTFQDIETVKLAAPDGFNFSLPDLRDMAHDSVQFFIALDDRGINISRTALFGSLRAAGIKATRLVASDVVVPEDAVIGENTLICEGVVLEDRVKIGYNAYVGRNATLSNGSTIGNCCFLGADVFLGRAVTIGDYSTVAAGLKLADKTQVGRYCELRTRQPYEGRVADKTFYLESFDDPVRIIAPL